MAEQTHEQIALERIEEAFQSKAAELDLTKLELKTLPKEIGRLVWLKKLDLESVHLISLPNKIGLLKNLKRKLQVFLCHSSNDKSQVRRLYKKLINDNIDTWLDEENLLPGQDWKFEITKAVGNSDAIIICLSKDSVMKEGFVQKEIRFALDKAEEKPEGTIFIIPALLEECEVPQRLTKRHWVKLFEKNGHNLLLKALNVRAVNLGLNQ